MIKKMILIGEESTLDELVGLCDDYEILMSYPEEPTAEDEEEFKVFFALNRLEMM